MRVALSALAAVLVVVVVALLAKSAKAYGVEQPSVQSAFAWCEEEPGRLPAPRSRTRPAVPGPCLPS